MNKALMAVWKVIPQGFRHTDDTGFLRGFESPDQSGNFHSIRLFSDHITFYPHPGLGNRLRLLSNHWGHLTDYDGVFEYQWSRINSTYNPWKKPIFRVPIDEGSLKEQAREIWLRIDMHAGTRRKT